MWYPRSTYCYSRGQHCLAISRCLTSFIFGPGNGFPMAINVVVVVVFFLWLLLSDFRPTKAVSFHNRSSSNFAYRLVTILSTIAPWQILKLIVRPLSTVEYTSVASVFHCRRGLTNLIHDRRGCTLPLFTLSSVGTSACLFHAGANGTVGYDTLTHSRLYSRDEKSRSWIKS